MCISELIKTNLVYYWRTNLAVVLGVATAVSVLAGALLVGESVRASLRDLFLKRLGKTDLVISSSHYFPETLARRVQAHSQFQESFKGLCPLIVTSAVVVHQENRRRASEVQVYGVDERFWQFHEKPEEAPASFNQRNALVSESLSKEIGIREGDSILIRLEAPSEIPAESLHGRKDETSRTVRLTARQILSPAGLGEFSLTPQQGMVHTVFVPLRSLQKELEQENRVNSLLVATLPSVNQDSTDANFFSGALAKILKAAVTLEDLGIRVRLLEKQQALSLEQSSTLLGDDLIAKGQAVGSRLGLRSFPILTYLANRICVADRQIPYSLVTAVDPPQFAHLIDRQLRERERRRQGENVAQPKTVSEPPIWLNEWAARDLIAKPGDQVTLDYYVWQEEGRLATKTANFRLEAVVPIEGFATDRDLVPEYPGISDSGTLSDWDPPFPMDLGLIRPKDEEYWKKYRTTPKAFVPLQAGQALWKTRYGSLTSLRFYLPDDVLAGGEPLVRFPPSGPLQTAASLGSGGTKADRSRDPLSDRFRTELLAELNPLQLGFTLLPIRAQGLAASRGATDFGEYFTYFSFFLVMSALLLAALFFRLGIEQRSREIGLLKAFGFAPGQIRNLFLAEGTLLSIVGSFVGAFGALAYGKFMMFGLRTFWLDAVGTTHLSLHVSPISLTSGALAGVVSALACIAWTLRALAPASPRGLLGGSWGTGIVRTAESEKRRDGEPRRFVVLPFRRLSPLQISVVALLLAGFFSAAAGSQRIGQVAGFFGAGTLLLVALLALQTHWLRGKGHIKLDRHAGWMLSSLGFRNATHRPGRSILCISLIAFATFIIVAVDAFRRDGQDPSTEKQSGTGGFPLFAQSLLPVFYDLNSKEGREAIGLTSLNESLPQPFQVFRFRVRRGEDTSCLNLYQPRSPRILAPTSDFLTLGSFAFQDSLASTEAEKHNPWLLLQKEFPDGAVPVIGDTNSLTYVLHVKVGQDWVAHEGTSPARMRVVAALADSLFQRELLMSETNFKRLFPDEEGYRFFLLDMPRAQVAEASQVLEERLSDYGFDVRFTAEQLASFHRVENTYLSTFQALGGLGLVLGTLGLAVVLLRNVLERRRELALLRAVGYTRWHLTLMILAENALLLFSGLATGILCALLAIAPALWARGGGLRGPSLGGLLLAVLLAGLVTSILATRAALRSPLLEALRSE